MTVVVFAVKNPTWVTHDDHMELGLYMRNKYSWMYLPLLCRNTSSCSTSFTKSTS